MNNFVFNNKNFLIVRLNIGPHEFIKLYSGSAKSVHAVAESGQSVRFPAHVLRPYVTADGVRGRFKIFFSSDKRFLSIERLQ